MNTCGTCKHWEGVEEKYHNAMQAVTDLIMHKMKTPAYGTCMKIVMDEWDDKKREMLNKLDEWEAQVVDGSGYYAALLSNETFGCTLWEAKEKTE